MTVLELIIENVSKATGHNSSHLFVFRVKDGDGSITIRRLVSITLGKADYDPTFLPEDMFLF